MVATPKEASTLVLLRDPETADGPPEVLLVRRGNRAGFGPGAYVFPGGVLDAGDFSARAVALSAQFPPASAARAMRREEGSAEIAPKALGFYLAAIRETFEEVGVLLARRADGDPFAPTPAESLLLQAARERINRGEQDFYQMVEELQLTLATGELVLFAHWITPEARPKRFDTRFFLAPAPEAISVRGDGREVFDHRWVSAAQALRLCESDQLKLMNPTIKNLELLAAFGKKEEALAELAGKRFSTVLPKIGAHPDGSPRLVHPWESDYHTF